MSPELKRIYFASFFSGLGNWMTSLVIFGWVYQRTNSPLLVGIGIVIHRLPISIGAWLFSQKAEWQPAKWRVKADILRAIFLSLIVLITITEPIGKEFSIVMFLAFAALRSLFSGADAAVEAKLISNYSHSQEIAARNQIVISYLFGLNGFIAAFLFFIGLLKFNYAAVLLFDAATFILSALAISSISVSRVNAKFDPNHNFENLFSVFFSQPKIWPYVLIHSLRNISMGIVMQQSLLLFKVKFNAGEESSAYLYMALTLAWFVSSKIRSYLKMTSLPLWVFYVLSVSVCAMSPFAWKMSSPVLIVLYVFIISFMDGFASASLASSVQANTKRIYLARVFSFLTISGNVVVVTGALLCGILADRIGYFETAASIAIASTFLLTLTFLSMHVFGNLHIYLYNRSLIRRLTQDFDVTMTMKEFTGKFPKLFSWSCSVTALKNGRVLTSGASAPLVPKISIKMIISLLERASYEMIERIGSAILSKNNRYPVSSGAAIYDTEEEAKIRALDEAIERDAVIYNYLTQTVPVLKFNGELLASGDVKLLDTSCYIISSVIPNKVVLWVRFQVSESRCSFGWKTVELSNANLKNSFEKAFSEAYATSSVFFIEEAKARYSSNGSFDSRFSSDLRLSENSNDKPSFKQVAAVLLDATLADRIKYLDSAPTVDSLVDIERKVRDSKPIRVLTNYTTEIVELGVPNPYYIARVESEELLKPSWPFLDYELIERLIPREKLTDNAFKPCIIY